MISKSVIALVLAACGWIAGTASLGRAESPPSGADRQIPTARITIYPGDEITEDLLVMKSVMGGRGMHGMVREINEAVGQVSRRTLVAGRPIPRAALRSKQDVHQGRQYKLVYQDAYLSISATGVALQSAAVGDIINVRNPDTGIVVRARIARDLALIVGQQ